MLPGPVAVNKLEQIDVLIGVVLAPVQHAIPPGLLPGQAPADGAVVLAFGGGHAPLVAHRLDEGLLEAVGVQDHVREAARLMALGHARPHQPGETEDQPQGEHADGRR